MPESQPQPSPHTLEFTGERVVPGQVDPDLLNEHIARYRFAAAFCGGADVVEAGCGTGYGTSHLNGALSVTAFDIAQDAVDYAKAHYARPGVRFLQAASEAIPLGDAKFDLMIAFELIEHLEHWPELLAEARRILRPGGVLLISTPNRAYYTESRAQAGPNPWHVHEFEYAEFETALKNVFPYVRIWTQNHTQAIVFAPPSAGRGSLASEGDRSQQTANFYLAACSAAPLAEPQAFAWVPSGGNVLREREHHVALLEGELRTKNEWLSRSTGDLDRLNQQHNKLLAELEERNRWAADLNTRLDAARGRIAQVQKELEERFEWVRKVQEQIDLAREEISREQAEIDRLNGDNGQLRQQRDQLRFTLEAVRQSRWVRLGRKLSVGPDIGSEP